MLVLRVLADADVPVLDTAFVERGSDRSPADAVEGAL